MAKITAISEDGILFDVLQTGDDVLSFSGRPFTDILDYIFADSLEEGEITFVRNGEKKTVSFRNEGGTLGLSFDESVEITPRSCGNNCIFCFVAQLPKGLRKTLYVKDDDYRLSFTCGSYITGTNLQEKDIERILYYKLSPLYISVHATDKEVQKKMLRCRKDFDQLAFMKRLIAGGIRLHTQIVMVGGVNDGAVLQKSLEELYDAGVETVAVVPVGLTKHRENLPALHPVTKEEAANAITLCERFYERHRYFCYCSDEMYQRAGMDVPSASYYGNYDQIENGVGLIAKFFEDMEDALLSAPKLVWRTVGVFTGVSGESTMQKAKEILEKKYPRLHINIYVVKNEFFGESVTVTGLVTATDILKQYGKQKTKDRYYMIPSVMLKEFGNQFLDNMTVEEVSKRLGKKIVVSQASGDGFVRAVTRGR